MGSPQKNYGLKPSTRGVLRAFSEACHLVDNQRKPLPNACSAIVTLAPSTTRSGKPLRTLSGAAFGGAQTHRCRALAIALNMHTTNEREASRAKQCC
jgi:hypothetical protein